MNYQTKLRELGNEMVSKLKNITDRPEGWLPHTVYIEEEGVDNDKLGIPVYNQYKLLDFLPDGECQLLNVITNEVEVGALCEIECPWLATLLNWYCELTGNHIEVDEPKQLLAFVYSIDMERNITDEELIKLWKYGKVTAYTPAEFAALLNDEMFDDIHNYVKFINN